ncbi:MAG: MBL fold metallo-hydrolase [Patescibacteria group bacterium]
MLTRRTIAWNALLLLLGVIVLFSILLVQKGVLRVSFLDVGQGDAILVTGPTGVEMLVDGGRDRSVLRELPRQLGTLDRSVSIVVATHPDADHVAGLADVFERYQVRSYIESGVIHETTVTERLSAALEKEEGLTRTVARSGQRLHLGSGAYADILYPDRDVSRVESNAGSIIMRVVYGDTSFLLTGDAPSSIEGILAAQHNTALQSDVLKAGHHGSKTSTNALFLSVVTPSIVVISAGRDNTYGHPHAEVLERIRGAGAHILSTAEEGTIEFVSDGRTVRQK